MSSDLIDGIRLGEPVELSELASCNETSVAFDSSAGPVEIQSWACDILRIRMGQPQGHDYGLVRDPEAPSAAILRSDEGSSLELGDYSIDVGFRPFTLSLNLDGEALLAPPSDGHFVRKHRIPPFSLGSGSTSVAFDLTDGERLYGTGERWGSLDLRGSHVDCYNTDSLGGNASVSYKNVPFVWSDRGWGLFVNTPAPVRFSLGDPALSHRSLIVQVEDGLDLFVMHGASPQRLLSCYHRLTGKPSALPSWVFGSWLSRAYYRTAEDLLEAARGMRERNMPCTTIVFDGRTWLDTATRFSFDWDASRYPAPAAVIEELKALGYRICVWVYPFCSTANTQYEELASRGVFLKDREKRPYIYRFEPEPFGKDLSQLPDSGMVDFTSESGREWWIAGCRRLLEQGVDCLKTDFGEQIPDDAVAANGDSGRRLHNVYALLYNKTTSEAFRQAKREPVLWARSAWSGSQRHPGHWCGDSQSDWGGLRTAVRGCLQWMLSGNAYTGSDIGGFFGGPPSPELYLRWLQFGALSPLMRMHGIGLREPYAYGKKVASIAQSWLELRYRLRPYLRRCAEQATADGCPIMRPMPLAYPDHLPHDRLADLQYMLGEDLLCVPMVDQEKRRRCWLPPGKWVDYFSGRVRKGGRWTERICTLKEIPLFLRMGSVVELAGTYLDDDATKSVLVAGIPDQEGRHLCGAEVTIENQEVLLRLPGNWRVDCVGGSRAEVLQDNVWKITSAG